MLAAGRPGRKGHEWPPGGVSRAAGVVETRAVSRSNTSPLLRAALAAVAALLLFAAPALAQATDATSDGGASVGTGDATGGPGGDSEVVSNPSATSGSSGPASASSSATNTGKTGDATSIAVSNPVATSGHTGSTGQTAPATARETSSPSAGPSSSGGSGTSSSGGDSTASGPTTAAAAGGGDAPDAQASSAGGAAPVATSTDQSAPPPGADAPAFAVGSDDLVVPDDPATETGGSPIGFSRPLPSPDRDTGTTLALLGLAVALAWRVRLVGTRPARA